MVFQAKIQAEIFLIILGSRAYNVRQEFAATEALYNATAFNVEQEVEFGGVTVTDDPEAILTVNHTVKVFPTTYNGLCKSYEFHDVHKIRTYAGMSLENFQWTTLYSNYYSVQDAGEPNI